MAFSLMPNALGMDGPVMSASRMPTFRPVSYTHLDVYKRQVIMSSISRLLVFIGLPSTYDNTITGIMLIVIVVVDALTQRRRCV